MKKAYGLLGVLIVIISGVFVSVSRSFAYETLEGICNEEPYDKASANLSWYPKVKGFYKTVDPIVQIVGRLDHLVEIAQRDGKVLYRAYGESRNQMGLVNNRLSCVEDVKYYKNLIIVRMGSKNDQLQMYGINRYSSGKVASLQQLVWSPRKSTLSMAVRVDSGAITVRVTNGKNRKIKNTFCWTPGKSWTYASKAAAGEFGSCDKTFGEQRNIAVR